MSIYNGTAAELENALQSIIPTGTLAELLKNVTHGSPYNVVSSDGMNSLTLGAGADLALIDAAAATIKALVGTPANPQGGYDNIGDLAVNVSNVATAPVYVYATDSAFVELQGTATVDGGQAPVFVVDSSHNAADVSLKAGAGHSFLIGGSGNDTLTGSTVSSGVAVMVAGSGNTTMTGGAGQDSLYGGGHTTMTGGSGAYQTLFDFTADAHDSITAGSGGFQKLSVASGSSVLNDASGHNDSLYAGSGSDTLYGSTNGSTEYLFQGNSSVVSAGSDTVFVAAATVSHSDTITASTMSGAMDTVSFGGQKADVIQGLVDTAKTLNGGSDSVSISFASSNGSLLTANLNNVSHIKFTNG